MRTRRAPLAKVSRSWNAKLAADVLSSLTPNAFFSFNKAHSISVLLVICQHTQMIEKVKRLGRYPL